MLEDSTRWLKQWAIITPDKTALITPDQEITFLDLNARVSRFANALIDRGVRPGDRVGCLMHNCVDFLTVFYGTLRAGAIFVSVNTRLSAKEAQWILENSGVKLLVTQAGFKDLVAAVLPALPELALISMGDMALPNVVSLDAAIDAASPEFENNIAVMSDRASINYTSGTTGYPKGAVLTHGALEYALINGMLSFGLSRFDTGLLALPLCFTGGLISLAHPMLNAGMTLVLEGDFDGERVANLIHRHQVTFTAGVPTTWQATVAAAADAPHKLKSLRLGTVGGAPVPATLLNWFLDNGIAVAQSYGLTEGGGYNMFLGTEAASSKPGSAGRPTLTSEAMVIRDDGQPADVDEVGELLLRGPSIMLEYWNEPELTAAAFHNGWLKTGDLVRRDAEGYHYLVDRKKDMIISGGLNIYPAEIERIIYEIEAVQEVCVIGLPDSHWGETVTAVIVVRPGQTLTEEDVLSHCRESMGSYKRPRRIEFVDSIPKTAAGKLLKRELRVAFAEAVAAQ